jgi:hypothetical protein
VPGLSYNRDAGTRVYLFYTAALLLILIRATSGRVRRVLKSDPLALGLMIPAQPQQTNVPG